MEHCKELLRSLTGDPEVEMTAEYEHLLKLLIDFKKTKRQERIANICEQRVLGIYWKPRTPYNYQRFYPGGDSDGGFLGWGETLKSVVKEDVTVLKEMGYSCQQVGLKLKEILDNPDVYNDEYETIIHRWMGSQICPFERKIYRHSSVDFDITNKKTGEQISGPGLIWHLVSEYGFFEGKKSPYRVDPKQLVKVLFG